MNMYIICLQYVNKFHWNLYLGRMAALLQETLFQYRHFHLPSLVFGQTFCANSVDPDQTEGAPWSESTQFAIPFALFGHIALW